MQDCTKLVVWQRARALTVAVHEAVRKGADRSVPGLRPQLLRATMSIGANIAEGASRDTRADFARFVTIAIGSASEVEHHLTVCADLGLLRSPKAAELIVQAVAIRRMLFGLRRALVMRDKERGR